MQFKPKDAKDYIINRAKRTSCIINEAHNMLTIEFLPLHY
jgi:hypothetical protein